MTKFIVIMIWIAFLLTLFSVFPDSYSAIFKFLGIALFVIHLTEYIAIKKMIKQDIDFIQTMLFGYGHWLPLLKK